MKLDAVELCTLANLATEVEARALESALALQGIPCILKNAETVGSLAAYGNSLAGVTVQIAAHDWEAAQALLHEQRAGAPWVCASCGTEVEADFDTCWQCSASRDNVTTPQNTDQAASTQVDDDKPQPLKVAFKRSVVGLFFLPVVVLFSIYSLAALSQVRLADLSSTDRIRFFAIMGFNAFMIWVWLKLMAWVGLF